MGAGGGFLKAAPSVSPWTAERRIATQADVDWFNQNWYGNPITLDDIGNYFYSTVVVLKYNGAYVHPLPEVQVESATGVLRSILNTDRVLYWNPNPGIYGNDDYKFLLFTHNGEAVRIPIVNGMPT